MNRPYLFTYKQADYKIFTAAPERAVEAIKTVRLQIESYIAAYPAFQGALEPLPLRKPAPAAVALMHEASLATGVGPMAAVAGTIAQLAAETASRREAAAANGTAPDSVEAAGTPDVPGTYNGGTRFSHECIIDNGGDLYIISPRTVVIGIYIHDHPLSGKVAFSLSPEKTPLAVCSSSSRMGHSISFGDCDLATVFAVNGALADAAATLACNSVQKEADLQPAAERIAAIPGIEGVFIVKGEKIALGGNVPDLVPHRDPDLISKVTGSRESGFR